MENKQAIEALNTAVAQLDAFTKGVVVSLHALKTSIQASPNFNQQVLEDSLDYFLSQPPEEYPDDFSWPLKALRSDMTKLLQQLHHQD